MTIRPVYKAYKIARRNAVKAKQAKQSEAFRPDPVQVETLPSKARKWVYAALSILALLSPILTAEPAQAGRGGGHGGGGSHGHHSRH